MIGYKGSDTMPYCNTVCWYVFMEPQYISSTTMDLIKTASANIASNKRDIPLSDNPYNALHTALFGTSPTSTEL